MLSVVGLDYNLTYDQRCIGCHVIIHCVKPGAPAIKRVESFAPAATAASRHEYDSVCPYFVPLNKGKVLLLS